LFIYIDQRRQGGPSRQDIDGMSPLYHAIFLADGDAPRMIRDAHDDDKSNCGPNGQNVLHVAALRSKGKSTSHIFFIFWKMICIRPFMYKSIITVHEKYKSTIKT
jgi:hypothetical protein